MNPNFSKRLQVALEDRGHTMSLLILDQAIDAAENRGTAERFEEFWRVFPKQRRKDKTKCRKKWMAKNLDSIAGDILEDVVYKKTNDWEWNTGFAPMPSTYLNNQRWMDDLTMPSTRADLVRYARETGKVWNGPVPKELDEEQSDWVDKYAPKGGW